MCILLVGLGGVGDVFVCIVVRCDFFELFVVFDYDFGWVERIVVVVGDLCLVVVRVDVLFV